MAAFTNLHEIMIKTLFGAMRKRKKAAALAALLLVAGGIAIVRAFGGEATTTRYVTSAAEVTTLTTTVTGSGQVSGETELAIKPEASGTVTAVYATTNQVMAEGDIIATLDATDAQRAVRDAQVNLQSAQLSLQKLEKSSDALSLLQAENALAQAERVLADLEAMPTADELSEGENAVAKAERDLAKAERDLEETRATTAQDVEQAVKDGYDAVAETFLDLPNTMERLADVVGTDDSEQAYIPDYELIVGSEMTDRFLADWDDAEDAYDAASVAYRASSQASDDDVKAALIELATDAVTRVSDALRSASDLISAMQEQNYASYTVADHVDEMETVISDEISLVNAHLSSLRSAADTIDQRDLSAPFDVANAEDAVENATATLAETTRALADLRDGTDADDLAGAREDVAEKQAQFDDLSDGTDDLDVQSQRLTVQQRQYELSDALEELDGYTIRAPLSGTLANLELRRGDAASSGTSVGTLVTTQKIAVLPLNEVDVTQVETGDRAALAFDAVEGLEISGEVIEIDAIGTVSQGVVSYDVKVAFDTQDERVRSGMTVSATITTEARQNVLTVENSAVKTEGDVTYVEVMDDGATVPRAQEITVGLANDTRTEVRSGLKAGDLVVTRTVTESAASAAPASPSAPSLFGGGGGGAGLTTRMR